MKEALKEYGKGLGLSMLLCIPSYTFLMALTWILNKITDKYC